MKYQPNQSSKLFRLVARGVVLLAFCVNASAGSLNDPTRPPISRVVAKTTAFVAPSGPRLTAILYSDERRVAVIDGKAMREGERTANGVVTHITADSVTLTKANRAEILRLPKPTLSIKSKSAIEGQP